MSDTPERPPRRDASREEPGELVGRSAVTADPLDHTPPPPFDRLRLERAAALVRPGSGEPLATLYTDRWKEAREHAARSRRTKAGKLLARLLDHQERGWEYVRPLALAVEEAGSGTPGPDPAAALYRFAGLEVVDLYRYNAFRCADMVIGHGGRDGVPSTDDIDAETDTFYMCVILLRMASAHRLAPPELRVLASHAAGLDRWYAEFAGVFAPAAEAFNRRRGTGP